VGVSVRVVPPEVVVIGRYIVAAEGLPAYVSSFSVPEVATPVVAAKPAVVVAVYEPPSSATVLKALAIISLIFTVNAGVPNVAEEPVQVVKLLVEPP
jgi:hypothetical protein